MLHLIRGKKCVLYEYSTLYMAKHINRVWGEHFKSQNKFCIPVLLFYIVFAGSVRDCSSLRASTLLHYVDMSREYGIIGIFCFVIEINFVF